MLRERRGGDRRQILGIAQTQSFHIATGVGFNQLEQQQSFSYLDRISKKKVEEERHWAVLYSSNINLSLSLCGCMSAHQKSVHYRNKKCERILNRGSSDFCE